MNEDLRACLRIESGPAAVDFGGGQGGEARVSPQRAIRAEPTPANAKRRADGPLSILRQALKERTKKFALRVIKMYTALRKSDTVAQVLGKQVLRSGTSVGANYREAHRARSGLEFVSKVGDCLKELEETAYWLELLVDSGCVRATKMARLLDETNQLTAIFTTIAKKSKSGL